MPAKRYDILIIGENLPGLVAAALLSSWKYSVLLIRKASGPGRRGFVGSRRNLERFLLPGIFERSRDGRPL